MDGEGWLRSAFLVPALLMVGCDDVIWGQTELAAVEQEGYAGVVEIIDQGCLGCHSAGAAQGQLDLETDPHAALVDAPSNNAGWVLVVPGSPDESLFFLKVSGQPPEGTGTEMPPGSGGLPEASIEVIRAWITDGAPDQ